MSHKFANDTYTPKNADKYLGNTMPRYRSSWELSFMQFCDRNPHILKWGSEMIKIPYRNPLTGKHTVYVPDFIIQYMDKNGNMNVEVIEIKPSGQSAITENQNGKERAIVAVNYAKWDAAQKWCQRQGLTFRVITEKDMFHNGRP